MPGFTSLNILGKIFKKLFGLSNARFYQMRKQAEKNNDYTMHHISETVSSKYFSLLKIKVKTKYKNYIYNVATLQ